MPEELWPAFEAVETLILTLAGMELAAAAQTVGKLNKARNRRLVVEAVDGGLVELAGLYEDVAESWQLFTPIEQRWFSHRAKESSRLSVAAWGNGWIASLGELLTAGTGLGDVCLAILAMAVEGGAEAIASAVEARNDGDRQRVLVTLIGGESTWLAGIALARQIAPVRRRLAEAGKRW
jgi:hypothetical protein